MENKLRSTCLSWDNSIKTPFDNRNTCNACLLFPQMQVCVHTRHMCQKLQNVWSRKDTANLMYVVVYVVYEMPILNKTFRWQRFSGFMWTSWPSGTRTVVSLGPSERSNSNAASNANAAVLRGSLGGGEQNLSCTCVHADPWRRAQQIPCLWCIKMPLQSHPVAVQLVHSAFIWYFYISVPL